MKISMVFALLAFSLFYISDEIDNEKWYKVIISAAGGWLSFGVLFLLKHLGG